MVIDVPYENLTHTLQCIKLQVIDSLPYVEDFIPSDIETPKQLFKYLKPQLTFKSDPRGVEYLQTMQTLFRNNGFGDCDCFTITALTALYWLNIEPIYVALTGNNKYAPSHIYVEVYDEYRGGITPFDLTNAVYGMERKYKFKQRLLFNL
jgi:hypothetical protein